MNLQELQTVLTNRLPIKLFLINNNGYHSIRITQNNLFKEHSKIGIGPESGDLSFPEFKKIAEAFGYSYYCASSNKEMKEVVDKVPDAIGTKEMWVTKVPDVVRRVDFELVEPVIAKRKDMNGICERVVIGYDFLRRVKFQDNWRNLATKLIKETDKIEHFMCNKPDILYRTFMSNMDDELLKALIRKEG